MLKRNIVFAPLLPHGGSPGRGVRRVAARAEMAGPGSMLLQYVLEADLNRVHLPVPVPGGGRADRLWAHTCFEAFVGHADLTPYLELNFSPSGEWAAYRFDTYRQGMAPVALAEPPRVDVRCQEQWLELEAEVHLGAAWAGLGAAAVSAGAGKGAMRIALSTVVEDEQGGLSYWALRHPPGRPDFHHPESFALALAFSPDPPP